MSVYRTSGGVWENINNNDNRVIVASDDAEVAMEIVVKFLEQTPGCSCDDASGSLQSEENSKQC